MSYLIERLTTELHYPLVTDDAELAAFTQTHENAVLLLPANPQRYPETLDVAVVLPELMQVFRQMGAAVASEEFAQVLAQRYGVNEWPSLLFLRQGEYLGVILRMRDWDVYLNNVQDVLASTPVRAPGVGIPVVAAPPVVQGACR